MNFNAIGGSGGGPTGRGVSLTTGGAITTGGAVTTGFGTAFGWNRNGFRFGSPGSLRASESAFKFTGANGADGSAAPFRPPLLARGCGGGVCAAGAAGRGGGALAGCNHITASTNTITAAPPISSCLRSTAINDPVIRRQVERQRQALVRLPFGQ